jgi:hypothetical protein
VAQGKPFDRAQGRPFDGDQSRPTATAGCSSGTFCHAAGADCPA